MRLLRVAAASTLLVLGVSCSATPEPDELGSSEQAITGTCSINQLGAPCDPDGAGPLQECQGVCMLRPGTGTVPIQVLCVSTTVAGIANNNGKICGVAGNGVGNCNQVCEGTLCVAKAAPDGAACRPSTAATDTLCDGQCVRNAATGVSTCTAITTGKCAIERLSAGGFDQNCVWDYCSATNAKTCVKLNLPANTACNDGNSCTGTDRCNGSGTCAGTPRVCPPTGNPCLVNACSPASGACVASPAPSGTACMFDRCSNGTCSAGTCTKGAAITCNDMNACTTDSCSPATGCVFTPIPGCGVDAGPKPDAAPPVDTGAPPFDTGAPFDTGGPPPVDSDVPPFDGGPIEEDSGGPFPFDGDIIDDGVPDTSSVSDSAESDAGDPALDEDLSRGGCGCNLPARSEGSVYAAALLALAIVTRRRR